MAPEGSIPISIENGCYVFDEPEATTHYIKSNQRKETWQGLHKRLNHASKEVMINTLNNTYGIQLKTKDLDDFFCPTCAIANSSRKGTSLLRNPDLKATQVGERVYCDVKTFKVPKRQGYKYYVIFVDEFSDWTAIYPINPKVRQHRPCAGSEMSCSPIHASLRPRRTLVTPLSPTAVTTLSLILSNNKWEPITGGR